MQSYQIPYPPPDSPTHVLIRPAAYWSITPNLDNNKTDADVTFWIHNNEPHTPETYIESHFKKCSSGSFTLSPFLNAPSHQLIIFFLTKTDDHIIEFYHLIITNFGCSRVDSLKRTTSYPCANVAANTKKGNGLSQEHFLKALFSTLSAGHVPLSSRSLWARPHLTPISGEPPR